MGWGNITVFLWSGKSIGRARSVAAFGCATCTCFARSSSAAAWPRPRHTSESRNRPYRKSSPTSNTRLPYGSSTAAGRVPRRRSMAARCSNAPRSCSMSSSKPHVPPSSWLIQRFSELYPSVVLHLSYVASPPRELPELRERTLDAILDRVVPPFAIESDAFDVEVLFQDVMVVAAGMQSPWARRRKIDLAELVDEPWILPPTDSWNYTNVAEAFRTRGLPLPKVRLVTFSVHLRTSLLTTGRFLTAFPGSVLSLDPNQFPLKVLPVDLPARAWPVVIVTLKNRTLNPVAQLFIDHLRAFTKTITAKLEPAQKSA